MSEAVLRCRPKVRVMDIKNSEKHSADIINFLPDATFIIDNDGRVIAWNHAIEAMTGGKAEEILGKGDHEYSPSILRKQKAHAN